MPTYQYRCTECGEELEAVQKFTDTPLSVCPLCQGQLRKLFSAVGVVFKGSGFYKTDSRSSTTSGSAAPGKKDPAAGATTTSGPSTEGGSEGSTSSSSGTATNGSGAGSSTTSGGSATSTGDGSKVA